MSRKRRQYSAEFKFKVALEAVKEIKTISQLASQYELHPNQISTWKKQLLQGGNEIFTKGKNNKQTKQKRTRTSPVVRTNRSAENGIGVAEKKS